MAAKLVLGLVFLALQVTAHNDPSQLRRSHQAHALHLRQSPSSPSASPPIASKPPSPSPPSPPPSPNSAPPSPPAPNPGPPASVAPAPGAPSPGAPPPAAPTPGAPSPSPPNTAPPSTLTATNPAIPPLASISSGMPSQATPPFTQTFSPGASPSIAGLPALPTTSLDRSKYPVPTAVAPTDSPLVQQWLKELDNVQIPDIPVNTDQALCASNPEAAADTTRCWWTCGGCTRPADIHVCPSKMDWGVSFDDGPSPYTPLVLDYLEQQRIIATFFVVGSSAYWNPSILQAEYMAGHQICAHTWFHQHLTTLSNEEIVAELGYTREIIKDIIGVTPTCLRPPYGDIDDRVRAISLGMGMVPMIWTRNPTTLAQFDTNDWMIPAGSTDGTHSFMQFQTILQNATMLNTGFIVLEHDLYPQTVDLAVGYTLPYSLKNQPPFNLKSINQCLGQDLKESYKETASNTTMPALNSNWAGNYLTGLLSTVNSSGGDSSSGGGGDGSGSGGGSAGSKHGNGAGRVELGAGAVLGGVLTLLLLESLG